MSTRSDIFRFKNLAIIIAVAAIYFLAAKLGLSLAFLNASVSPVWPPTGVAIAIGNTMEAVAAVYLIRKFVGSRNPFNRAIDVLRFVVFAAILSTALSAT